MEHHDAGTRSRVLYGWMHAGTGRAGKQLWGMALGPLGNDLSRGQTYIWLLTRVNWGGVIKVISLRLYHY